MTENDILKDKYKHLDAETLAGYNLLNPARKSGYICPFCGNGSGEDGTGVEMNLLSSGYEGYCHKCGASFDVFKLIAKNEHLNNDTQFAQIFQIAKEKFGDAPIVKENPAPKKSAEKDSEKDKKISAEIEKAHKNLANFPHFENFKYRGLEFATLNKFYCGYEENFFSKLEDKKNNRVYKVVAPRFIIPSSKTHYLARLVGKADDLPIEETAKKLLEGKSKQHFGTKTIFAKKFALTCGKKIIFAVEGEFDAMSIWQCGYPAIAFSGSKLSKEMQKELKEFAEDTKFIILLDNDETGENLSQDNAEIIDSLGFSVAIEHLDKKYKDANEFLQADPDGLKKQLEKILQNAEKFFEENSANAETGNGNDAKKAKLQRINSTITELENEKKSAIEKLRGAERFDRNFIFSTEILNAAAIVSTCDKPTFREFKFAVKNQNPKDNLIRDWEKEIKIKSEEFLKRQANLLAQKKYIDSQIVSSDFVADNAELNNFSVLEDYQISSAGIEKLVGDKSVTVSRVPVIIKSKIKKLDTKTFRYVLSYLSDNGKWQDIPAKNASTIFNARKLIDLSDYGLPVTSSNANLLVDYLDAFKVENEKNLPLYYETSQCGWHTFGDNDYFVDPRRKNLITDNGRNAELVADDSSNFTKSLKSAGSLEEWKKAYDIAKKSPVARLTTAASIAAPLLKPLDERNFVLYVHSKTLSGKSTSLYLGSSAVGKTDMVVSFDGTNNGLLGMAAETTDFSFFVDEKQAADQKLKDQFQRFIYSVANGKERTRANKDGSIKNVREWKNITICNGETELLADNSTGGAHSRLLQIAAPKKILSADDCKTIRGIIKKNYGLILPLVIDEFFKYGFDNLRELYNEIVKNFTDLYPYVLQEYCRYVALLTVADAILNITLGVEENFAFKDAIDNARKIFDLVPTNEEISDTPREIEFVTGFITQNQKCFLNATVDTTIDKSPRVYGKFDEDFVYITTTALKDACKQNNFDYNKIVADLSDEKFFLPDDKIPKGRKKPYSFVVRKIGRATLNCFRIPEEFINNGYAGYAKETTA